MVPPRDGQRRGPDPCRGVERDVTFADATPRHATPEACAGVDAAYHAKYDRYGPTIVGSAEWRGL